MLLFNRVNGHVFQCSKQGRADGMVQCILQQRIAEEKEERIGAGGFVAWSAQIIGPQHDEPCFLLTRKG